MLRWVQRSSPLLALLLLAQTSPTCNAPASFSLGMPKQGQQQSNWCWAAAGAMVMNRVNTATAVSQCAQANAKLGRGDCCPTTGTCNVSGYPQFEKFDFSVKKTSDRPQKRLSWSEIKCEIAVAQKPFTFVWRNKATDAEHMLVATGYGVTKSGQAYLIINDPLPKNAGDKYHLAYADYVGGDFEEFEASENYYNVTFTGTQ